MSFLITRSRLQSHFHSESQHRLSRLNSNNGKGNFTLSEGQPKLFITGSCASVSDVDHDGDMDDFLAARAIPWRYGDKPDSYILINDGKGNFSDVTKSHAPGLQNFGFVKNVEWSDINGDGNYKIKMKKYNF